MQKESVLRYRLFLTISAPSVPKEKVVKLAAMDRFAKSIARKYGGVWDGNGIGLGRIDEIIDFGTKVKVDQAANFAVKTYRATHPHRPYALDVRIKKI